MKEIGAELGVNESRVSQLHARAIRRLRDALGADIAPATAIKSIRAAILAFEMKPRMAKADIRSHEVVEMPGDSTAVAASALQRTGVVVPYDKASRAARSKSPSRNGLASQRQPVSSKNRSASVPATAPVTKMTRRASAGVAAAMAR